jgi:hypothetical protein
MATAIVVIVTLVVVVVLVVWFFKGTYPTRGVGGVPEARDSDSDRFYNPTDRPAGPDAEAMVADTEIPPPPD